MASPREEPGEESAPDRKKTVAHGGWFTVFALALLASIGFFGYSKQPKEMGIAVSACVLAMIFARLNEFTEFKGFGIAGKLRQVDRRAEKASATAEQVRQVSAALGAIVMELLAKFDVWGGGLKIHEKVDLWSVFRARLKDVGVRPAEINALGAPLNFAVRFRLALLVKQEALGPASTDPKHAALDTALCDLFDYTSGVVPSSKELAKALRAQDALTPNVQARIDDLAFFEKNGALRRPELTE